MTSAPPNLLAVRKLLLTHLDIDPTRARSIDLESAEVGIVGDTAHVAGGDSYHLGRPEQDPTGSYSVGESPRDRAGLTSDASALDVGEFEVTVGGRTYDLPHFSAWCVGQCKAGAADTRDIREIIWSPDGRTVKRWDRLGKRSTGDSSHRYHTHLSWFRDATKAGRDLTPLFERYLTTIGLIQPTTPQEGDMFPDKIPVPVNGAETEISAAQWARAVWLRTDADVNQERFLARTERANILAAVKAGQTAILAGMQGLNTEQVLARINEVAAAEAARDAQDAQRDAELAALLRAGQSGEMDMDAMLRRLGEVIAAGTASAS